MRVLYLSQYFPPEVGATQTRAHEMARYLVAQGHQVTMLAEVPNHPAGIIPPAYRGKLWERRRLDGIDVIRLAVITAPEKGFRARMLFYLSYMGMAILAGLAIGLRLRRRYDVIYATSPPLFAGLAGAILSVLLRTRFVFEVRDLWPESAVALGELTNPRAIRLAEYVERFCYHQARRIVVVTQGIAGRLAARRVRPGRVHLIPNGANVDQFHPAPEQAARLRATLGLDRQFVAIYAGIHGVAQSLETLVAAAHLLRGERDIVLLLVGEGPRKAEVRRLVAAQGLANLQLLAEQPRPAMAGYLSLAGCTIVPLKNDPLFAGALPSKLFEGLACETAVVLSAPAGEASAVLAAAAAGIHVPPEDPAALANAIRWLRDHPAEAAAMGRRGRAFVSRHYTRQEGARRLERLLRTVGAPAPGRRGARRYPRG
ncbi:MAG TPA: glycosyltransferase family 4 protein [Chloroflexia bacterium]|nr:glycosyltransferase family 4 protein [Chloroflexia bacterium]